MASPSLIRLEDVWKIYQLGKIDLTVLKGVSLEINPGDFVAIVGSSGSGKSTLLNLIGCLDVPTRGSIFFRGRNISQLSTDELSAMRGQKIGFVFQQFNLLPNLTALENVMLPMIFQGVSQSQRKERAEMLLVSLGLKQRMNHRPMELSGGEQQRVAVARAFSNDPDLILADEPTGNLDSKTGEKIMEILVNFHQKQGKTIVVVTHDFKIADYTEKMINIKDGEVVKNHQTAKNALWQL